MMSSSANPRKFSEKIAIQQRKLNEEQSAFQQIMHEVHTITRFPTPVAAQALGAPNVSWNQRVAGSLPNVFEIAYHAQAQRPDLQAFANPLLYANQWPGTSGHPSAAAAAAAQLMIQTGQPNAQCSVGQSPMYPLQQQQQRDIGQPSGYHRSSHPQPAIHRGRSPGSHPHYHPYRTPSPHHSPVGSAVGSPNLRARSPDRPQLTPPCQSASYLVPPQDSGWRRTHSDPGIHASVTNPNMVNQSTDGQLAYPSSTMNHMGSSCNSPNVDVEMPNAYLDPKLYYPGVQRLKLDDPVINMQTLNINAGDLSAASSQASISSNTGSLPDLTQVPTSTTGQSATNPPNQTAQHHQQQPLHYSQSLGYGQSSTSAAMGTGFHPTGVNSDLGSPSGVGGPIVSHQQRHSIQLPVQYAQGHFTGSATSGNTSLYSFPGSQSSSPAYQADSPQTGPNSPATTANSESPGNASQQGQSSPGSPYYSLPAQLQNINIEASDFQPQQSVYISSDGSGQQQIQFRVPINPNVANQYQQMNCSTQYQIQTSMVTPPPYQPPSNKITGGAQQPPCEIYGQMQPPLPSPNSGKIPNIILTGPCDSNAASTSATFIDPAVAMLSSDLRLTLDPSDLESLQVLSNEHDLIDADTEDALRGDRV